MAKSAVYAVSVPLKNVGPECSWLATLIDIIVASAA